MRDDSEKVPALLTDYILKGKNTHTRKDADSDTAPSAACLGNPGVGSGWVRVRGFIGGGVQPAAGT